MTCVCGDNDGNYTKQSQQDGKLYLMPKMEMRNKTKQIEYV